MTNNQDEKLTITLTIRLKPELAERLRLAGFRHRMKKQHLMQAAVRELLARENARPAAVIRKKWKALTAAPPETSLTRQQEKLRLAGDDAQALRKFAYDYHLYKQAIVEQALVEYLEQLARKGKR